MSLLSRLAMIGVLIGGYKIYQDRANQKYWKQYEDSLFNSESEGEKVRNRLQGSDVYPEEDMLETPSIYRDWPMVQKGYQSLRMMNDNDNFNSETVCQDDHLDGIDFLPWSEEAEGPECYITGLPNPEGDIEGEDNICEPCQSKWIYDEGGPEGEGYYRASVFDAEGKVRRHALNRFTKKRKPSGDTFRQRGRRAAVKSMFANEAELKKGNVRSISGGDVKLRKLKKDKDLKPADAVDRLEISAESGDTVYYIDYVSHDGHLWGDAGALNYGETGPYATKEGAEAALSKMLAQEVLEWEEYFEDLGAFSYELAPDGDMRLKPPNMDLDDFQMEYSMPTDKSIHQYNGLIYEAGVRERQIMSAEGEYTEEKMLDKIMELQQMAEKYLPESIRDDAEAIEYSLAGVHDNLPKLNDTQELAGEVVLWTVDMFQAYEDGELDEDTETFNAYVYRGKPMEDLNYSQKAVATKKMIDAADLEATMLQLENAIRLGIISEDELMKELQTKFGSK